MPGGLAGKATAMITAHVKLFATLRRVRPDLSLGQSFPVALPEGATIADLVSELGLPEEEVKLIFVNAHHRELDHVLADGDEVGIFPPVGGG
jgi:molybdopterin synthase sulfur carrier subunit